MARLDRPQNANPNPATLFLEWKSKEKRFSYYDKAQKVNIPVELPFKFLFLEHYHNIKGWSDSAGSGIFSNEVYSIGSEPMTVKAFKGQGNIAEGMYKEIKNTVASAGGVYHRSVYAMLEDGSIVNIQLKGSAVAKYSEFYKGFNGQFDNTWIEILKSEDGKKGAVSYSMPIFSLGKEVTKDEDALANKAVAILQAFVNTRSTKEIEVVGAEAVESEEATDGLDF